MNQMMKFAVVALKGKMPNKLKVRHGKNPQGVLPQRHTGCKQRCSSFQISEDRFASLYVCRLYLEEVVGRNGRSPGCLKLDNFNFTVCNKDKLMGFICETNIKEVKNVPLTFKISQAIPVPADDYNMTAGSNETIHPYDF